MANVTKLKTGTGMALAPATLDEALRFADVMSKSDIVPKDYQGKPGNVLVAVQWGQEIGLQPLQAMQSIAVINGRPSIWGDAMLALVRSSGLLEYIKEDINAESAVCVVKRMGEKHEVVREFTMDDAKRAGLAGKAGPWQQYPKRMLQMRARAFALRDTFPDILRGVHIAEEAQDMPEIKDITPAEEQPKGNTGVKAKLAAKKAEAKDDLAQSLIDEILERIRDAKDETALKAVTTDVEKLTSKANTDRAREAYKAKLAELRTPAQPGGPELISLILKEIQNGAPIDATLSFYSERIGQLSDEDKADLDAEIAGIREEMA